MKNTNQIWDEIFKQEGKVFEEAQEDVPKLIPLFKKYNVKRILDLGCGTGRHVVFLAKNGFEVYGLDNAESAINLAKECLHTAGLKGYFATQEMFDSFPYKDNFLDAIISTQVIHHGKLRDIQKIVKEIERTVKKGGIIFITVSKDKNRATKFKKIAPQTYIPLDGWEKGLTHYIFKKDEFQKLFCNFDIIDMHLDSTNHYCLTGIKK